MKQAKVRLGNRFGFIESGINIVYDATKALQHKQEMDKAVSDYEKWEKKQYRIKLILGLLLMAVFVVALVVVGKPKVVFLLGITCAFPIAIITTFWEFSIDSMRPAKKYTPDIEYYLATEGKQTLSITVEPTSGDCLRTVRIITENADRSTNRAELNFKVVEKTDLHHIVLNVNEGVVYVPYEKERKN